MSLNYRTYAVGDPAFGRAVRYLLLCFGFCARGAQKPKHRYMGSTLLPQAKRRLYAAPRKSCKKSATLPIHLIKEAQQDQATEPETKGNRFDPLDIQFAVC
jgi:hypothetical protein